MTDTSRYEGWLVANYDIGSYTQGDMRDILSRNTGFNNMTKESQQRILDNWFEFEKEVEVEVPEVFEGVVPETKEELTFWKKIRRVFWRRGE